MRTARPLLSLLLSAVLLAAGATAAAQGHRVDTATALSHAIKKADATVPEEAKAKKIGGPVIADVEIDAKGTVASLVILSGPELLRPEAERALRQWVFKPFTVNGKPVSVQAILEVDFPDPIREEERRRFDDFRAAYYQCRRELEREPSQAEAPCAAAIRSAELLPLDRAPGRVSEVSLALEGHARALMASGRLADAIVELERVDGMRRPLSPGPSVDSADIRQTVAILHQQLGENEKADAEFSAAISEYTAFLQRAPEMQDLIEPGLKIALSRHARLKRSLGDAAGASALEARAAAIAAPSPSLPPLAITRSVDALEVTEPIGAALAEEDLGDLRKLLAAGGRKAWRLELRAGSDSDVYAFFAPDIVTGTFRRGPAAILTKWPVSQEKNAPRAWRITANRLVYIQLASGGGDPANESPVPVLEHEPSALKDEDLVAIVSLVRETAARKPTEKYLSDIQPWPIRDIWESNQDEVRLTLRDAAHEDHFQGIRMRRAAGRWSVVELSELGRSPRR